MRNRIKSSIAGLALALAPSLPMTASAAPGDAAYCSALATKYENLVVNRGGGRGTTQSGVGTAVALDQCKNGNPAGIPVLEQKLRDLKIELPPRN